jgi:hypothetical protein
MGRRGKEDKLETLRQKGQNEWLLLSKMVAYLPWCQRSFVVFCECRVVLIVNWVSLIGRVSRRRERDNVICRDKCSVLQHVRSSLSIFGHYHVLDVMSLFYSQLEPRETEPSRAFVSLIQGYSLRPGSFTFCLNAMVEKHCKCNIFEITLLYKYCVYKVWCPRSSLICLFWQISFSCSFPFWMSVGVTPLILPTLKTSS